MSTEAIIPEPEAKNTGGKKREPDAIYQKGRVVARVLDAEMDTGAKEICFGEVYKSDEPLLPDQCEYRQFRILI